MRRRELRLAGSGCLLAILAVVGCASSPPASSAAAPSAPASETSAPPPTEPAAADPGQEIGRPQGGPGWLGVELQAAPAGEPGAIVRHVVRGAPADRAGLAAGDVVLQLDGQSVSAPSDVVAIVRERRAGERVSVGFRRGERERLVAAVLAAVPSSDQVLKMSYLGAPAPRLGPLKTVQGSLLPGLDTLRGKVTVIEFWASWCGVCPILVPTMNDWHARYGAQGVQVVGITTDQVAAAASTASRQGMAYPIWSDESGETTEAYRALALPTVFVLDRSGVVRDVMVGYSSVRVAELESLVGRLLAQQ